MTRTLVAVVGLLMASQVAEAGVQIEYRSFSASAAIGPPAEAFAVKLTSVTKTALGDAGEVDFVKLAGLPAIPPQFADIMTAVEAGKAGGGFDAAYISGTDLNKAWGFIFNSGVPFGPTFDEFMGFMYGNAVDDGQRTGLTMVQDTLAARNIIALPVVGSPEQLSGYFPAPMSDVDGHHGIGLVGLCQQDWKLRYLPPGENVLNLACDKLVGRDKRISFIEAVPGGGSLIGAVLAGQLQGFEFATPLDDVSQLFTTKDNPGTTGLRFVHTPGWQQQFLLTWMLINKGVWNALTPGQQVLVQSVARDHVLTSYGENLRQQGTALQFILDANKHLGDPRTNMVLTQWSMADQRRLRDATIQFLNAHANDTTLPAADRLAYVRIIEALRVYVHANDHYWDKRQVNTSTRFDDWANALGQCWDEKCGGHR